MGLWIAIGIIAFVLFDMAVLIWLVKRGAQKGGLTHDELPGFPPGMDDEDRKR